MHRCPVCNGDTAVQGRECLVCRDAKLSGMQLGSIGYTAERERSNGRPNRYQDIAGTARELQKMRASRRQEIRRLRGVRSHGR